MTASSAWPALPLAEWQATLDTLHMWTQIVGKTRLALAPMQNHWWQVALYLTPRGLTTSAMPCGDRPSGERSCSVDFDFLSHQLMIQTGDDRHAAVPLVPQSVAQFYGAYEAALASVGVRAAIHPVPVEVETAIPFTLDRQHATYDPASAQAWWQIMLQADRVMKAFRGRFLGKSSPSHFFWGSFDLAVTRFSGRPAPRFSGAVPNCPAYVMEEAYSHECSSAGLWPGGGALDGPAFYSYAYPEPPGFADYPVRPAGARYDTTLREFVLPYDAVRCAAAPDEVLLEFFQSTYEGAATLGRWDRASLERPDGATSATP